MAKLILIRGKEEIDIGDAEVDEGIQEHCEGAGIPFACRDGICGTCIVEVVEGDECLSKRNELEIDFFGFEGKERLSCQCRILKEGVVKLKQ